MNKLEVVEYLGLDSSRIPELVKNKKIKVKEFHPSGRIKSYDKESVIACKLDIEERLKLKKPDWIDQGSGSY